MGPPEMLLGFSFFAMVAFIVWVVAESWRRRAQQRAVIEFNTRLLDRISSLKDFNEFAHSEQGARFMDSMSSERASIGPSDRILRASHIGIIVAMLGVGFLLVGFGSESENAVGLGGILLALGLGYLISSVVSFRLAGKLGVLDRKDRGDSRASPAGE